MIKITEYSQISPLVMKYFKKGVVTNNFLCKDDYVSEIAEGKLFAHANDTQLVFYIKREGFYYVFFHTLDGKLTLDSTEYDLVCEASGEAEKLLQDTGFGKRILDRVFLKNDTPRGDYNQSVSVSKAMPADAAEIYALMENSFDKETGFLPTLTQIKLEIEKGLVYKAVKDGKIKGTIRRQIFGKNSRIRHLCVQKGSRGEHIGQSLCAFFLNKSDKATVWTGRDNMAAIGLYKSMGFVMDKTTSAVYKREGTK